MTEVRSHDPGHCPQNKTEVVTCSVNHTGYVVGREVKPHRVCCREGGLVQRTTQGMLYGGRTGSVNHTGYVVGREVKPDRVCCREGGPVQ
jgi:hypothetical protein